MYFIITVLYYFHGRKTKYENRVTLRRRSRPMTTGCKIIIKRTTRTISSSPKIRQAVFFFYYTANEVHGFIRRSNKINPQFIIYFFANGCRSGDACVGEKSRIVKHVREIKIYTILSRIYIYKCIYIYCVVFIIIIYIEAL